MRGAARPAPRVDESRSPDGDGHVTSHGPSLPEAPGRTRDDLDNRAAGSNPADSHSNRDVNAATHSGEPPVSTKAADRRFDVGRVRRWRKQVYREFQRAGFTPAAIMAQWVLAGVAAVGPDLDVLSELTGHSPAYVKTVLKRLRKQRVLQGQTLRGAWDHPDHGSFAVMLDAGVAAGVFARGVDQTRSAAQKARKPETRARGPRRPRVPVTPGAVFTPKVQKADPTYGLPGWKDVR